MWMAGGGVKGGQHIGTTDEIGMYAQEQRAHVNDLHASMLWALGLDHLRVTFHAQRPGRARHGCGRRSNKVAVRIAGKTKFAAGRQPNSSFSLSPFLADSAFLYEGEEESLWVRTPFALPPFRWQHSPALLGHFVRELR